MKGKILSALIVVILLTIVFSGCLDKSVTDEEHYLEDYWVCDRNSELSDYLKSMQLRIDNTYGHKQGDLYQYDHLAAESINWDYDESNSILTLKEHTNAIPDWNITLKAVFDINTEPKQLTTYYIDSSGSAVPQLKPELFNNIQWISINDPHPELFIGTWEAKVPPEYDDDIKIEFKENGETCWYNSTEYKCGTYDVSSNKLILDFTGTEKLFTYNLINIDFLEINSNLFLEEHYDLYFNRNNSFKYGN
jgi:hypothetical protein